MLVWLALGLGFGVVCLFEIGGFGGVWTTARVDAEAILVESMTQADKKKRW